MVEGGRRGSPRSFPRSLLRVSAGDRVVLAHDGPVLNTARAFSAAVRQPGETRSPIPREPWDPRAVSHPRLLAVEFPALVFKESGSPATE